jgi:DNA-directed RNA polymerase I, II, and III subunit RPABC1
MTSFYLEIQAIDTLKKMLTDRGYILEEDSKEDFTIRSTKIGVREKDTHKIISFICNDKKLSIQGIKDYMSIMNREGYNRCIIIYRDSVTSSAKKSLENLDIELFSLQELQLDITQHRLVPKHERATKEEKEQLEKSFKGRLPTLLHTDPISRYYYFQRGEYIRITRKDGSVMYRVVK